MGDAAEKSVEWSVSVCQRSNWRIVDGATRRINHCREHELAAISSGSAPSLDRGVSPSWDSCRSPSSPGSSSKLGKPLPKAGVFAHGEAEVVAKNIAHAITGKGKPARFDGHGECFIEAGDGKAGYGAGNFYAEPVPQIKVHPPARRWHAGKVLFEKHWLSKWF
jgi:hypothetical protein